MKIVHAMPEIEAKCSHSKVKKRKREYLPGMNQHMGHGTIKVPDHVVIQVILDHLRTGACKEELERRHHVPAQSIKNWISGVNRSKCYRAALRIHLDSMKPSSR